MTIKERQRKEANEKKREQIANDNVLIGELNEVAQAFMEEQKARLPQILDERKKSLIEELKQQQLITESDDENLTLVDNQYPYQEVIDKMFKKPILNWREKEAQYSPAELYEIYAVFSDMCVEITKMEKKFTPSLDLFFTFADIGLETFKKWQANESYRPVCDKIYAYIGACISDNGMRKIVDSRTATFLQERDLGKQLTPNVTVVGSTFNSVIGGADMLSKIRKELADKTKK